MPAKSTASMILTRKSRIVSAAALLLAAASANAAYVQTNLVTDDQAFLTSQGYAPAAFVDPHLINPWGVSYGPTGPFWVSNQGDATSTLYNGAGAPQPLVVTVPGAPIGPSGPTGQVFNGTSSFATPSGAIPRFLFANLDGSISGWVPGSTTATVLVNPSGNNVYTGLTLASSGGSNYLYAANRAANTIDVYDSSFTATTLAGSFTDPGLPAGYSVFNVKAIGGSIFVTYAAGGPDADEEPLGNGFVSEFTADGSFVRRFASGGQLASPWGLSLAPTGFAGLAGALLVGNFSEDNGFINAYSLSDGSYLGALQDLAQNRINIPYLWEILPGNGGNGGATNQLYFAAGIGDEEHGLFGTFAFVPEPSTWAMMIAGFGMVGGAMRRRTAMVAA